MNRATKTITEVIVRCKHLSNFRAFRFRDFLGSTRQHTLGAALETVPIVVLARSVRNHVNIEPVVLKSLSAESRLIKWILAMSKEK